MTTEIPSPTTARMVIGGDTVEAAVCELWFEHAGDGEVEAAIEQVARRQLEGLGPVELGCLDDCAVAEGSRAQYVLMPAGDPDAVQSFCARGVPRLRASGCAGSTRWIARSSKPACESTSTTAASFFSRLNAMAERNPPVPPLCQ